MIPDDPFEVLEIPEPKNDLAFVYIIHLEKPFGLPDENRAARERPERKKEYQAHARHYVGFTTDLIQRLKDQREGKRNGHRGSSVFMLSVKEAGIDWEVSRIWQGHEKEMRLQEAKIKKAKCTPRYCPKCRAEKKAEKRRIS